jgi:hypothetical protein
MKALLTGLAAGLGLLAVCSLGSAQATVGGEVGPVLPGCVPPKLTVDDDHIAIALQGRVHKTTDHAGRPLWSIYADGRTYYLDLGPAKQALKEGQALRVKGRLQHRFQQASLPHDPPAQPFHIKVRVVVAESIEPVSDARRGGFVHLEVHGELHMHELVGYPSETLAVVRVDGQLVVLDFGR